MYIDLHVKYPLLLSDFNQTENSRQSFEKCQISSFMKIRPVGAEFFRADRQRGMAEVIVAFAVLRRRQKLIILSQNISLSVDIIKTSL
jgi:hypothetical protein